MLILNYIHIMALSFGPRRSLKYTVELQKYIKFIDHVL